MIDTEILQSKTHITVEIIEYIPETLGVKTILKKSTGKFSVASVNSGGMLTERTTSRDTFVMIIEGKADIVIDGKSNLIVSGQSIVIAAHIPHFVKQNGRFKMILAVLKTTSNSERPDNGIQFNN
jgi:mannose-6-phosphate isomerase-like protein (cupin superfamily)